MQRLGFFLFCIFSILLFGGCVQSICITQILPAQNGLSTKPPEMVRNQIESSQKALQGIWTNLTEPEEDMQSLLNRAIAFCNTAKDYRIVGDFDAALEALDNAYSIILKINTRQAPELDLQKKDLRFKISKRILEIHTFRKTAVVGKHGAIPLVMNGRVMTEIKMLTRGGKRSFFYTAYKRSGRYRSHIVQALEAAELPAELSWLPLIESGYRQDALSHARALGLWQFIPSTGYKFGLSRDNYIDERLDPIKSTQSAVAYLNELHGIFGDWATALAAYNCGEKTVLRLIREQNIGYLDTFWDIYDRLPDETQRYVARFLATLHIVNNPKKYGFDSLVLDEPIEYETVSISRQVSLRDLSKKIGTSEKTMKSLNPELRYGILPDNTYTLRIPKNTKDLLLARLSSVPISPSLAGDFIYHRVRNGETLSSIARNYRTSMTNIALINNINKSGYIVVGKVLKIPQDRTLTFGATKKALAKAS